MNKNPTISIVVPIYNMDNAQYFLERNLYSIAAQTFQDYEIVISDDSLDDTLQTWLSRVNLPLRYYRNNGEKGMASNINNGIWFATGKLVKFLFQDDYFFANDSLEEIVKHFTPTCWWLATGCTHSMDGINTFNDHKPYYSESENTLGSPSVITFRREIEERFDPNFHWTLDLDLYRRLYRKYGKPKMYDPVNVVIGIHSGQKTHLLSDERKVLEHKMLKIKFENYD